MPFIESVSWRQGSELPGLELPGTPVDADFTPGEKSKDPTMRKILLIKTSSLGDVVHNLPVVTDIRRNFPNAVIDWVVEEAYLPLVQLHPGVHEAIPVAIRRWRRRPLKFATWTEMRKLRQTFRHDPYELVIDTQGLIKSALLAAAAQGRRHGFDAASAREPIAARFYDVCHHVARSQHAVVRNRELAARALGYRNGDTVDFGLRSGASPRDKASDCRIVLLHSTSRADKHWPEERWLELGNLIESAGGSVVLPWGSSSERLRSERIASSLRHAQIPGALSIQAVAALLAQCSGVAGLDTGLTHLAAAFGTPVAAIYCATDPGLTGVYGSSRAQNLGGPDHAPQAHQVFEMLQTCGAL